jgi:hypothetical protein
VLESILTGPGKEFLPELNEENGINEHPPEGMSTWIDKAVGTKGNELVVNTSPVLKSTSPVRSGVKELARRYPGEVPGIPLA